MTVATNVRLEALTEGETLNPMPNLGSHDLTEARLWKMLSSRGSQCQRKFSLSWTGSKIPRGVVLLGHEIVWTQHGRVIARGRDGKDLDIGVYERFVEWGGPSKDSHTMFIGVFDSLKDLSPGKEG